MLTRRCVVDIPERVRRGASAHFGSAVVYGHVHRR